MIKIPKIFCTALFLILSTPYGFAANVQPLDRILVVVEDDVILATELDQQLAQVKKQLKSRGTTLPPEESLRSQVLERMIVETLQLQEANRRGIEVDDLTLNETMNQIARQNRVSLEEFSKQLAADGISYEIFRADLRKEIAISRLTQRMVASRITISEQEIDEFLASQQASDNAEYLLSHILIAVPENTAAEKIKQAEQQADVLYKDLVAGKPFDQLAATYSNSQNALEGGTLGWRKGAELPKLFSRELINMKAGDFSHPLRSPSGFHLIKLEDVRGGDKRQIVPQLHARHILIKTNAVIDDNQARQQLNDIRRQLSNGGDFAALAKQYSEDHGSATEGGDLGWTESTTFVPTFRSVVDSLPLKKLSEPFQSQYGWHIVEVLERRQYDKTEDLKRTQVRELLFKRKAAEEEDLWIRRIREQAYVDYRLDAAPKKIDNKTDKK